jgi:hypothetical protein
MRTRRPAISATAPLLLLDDGTLAFTDAAGELAVQHPGLPAPTVLAPPGFSAPAFGYDTLYWTAGGAPHRWSLRPPEPPGRSPGAS